MSLGQNKSVEIDQIAISIASMPELKGVHGLDIHQNTLIFGHMLMLPAQVSQIVQALNIVINHGLQITSLPIELCQKLYVFWNNRTENKEKPIQNFAQLYPKFYGFIKLNNHLTADDDIKHPGNFLTFYLNQCQVIACSDNKAIDF